MPWDIKNHKKDHDFNDGGISLILSKTTKFRRSKLRRVCNDNFIFDENGRKLSKRVENAVGTGEIARNKQFLLFPQCFQKAYFPGASKGVIVWEWVTLFQNDKV